MTTHSRMGIYSITHGTYDELVERAQEGLAQVLRESPGFVSYSLTGLSDGRIVSLSTWETRDQAETAGVTSADWVGENLADSVAVHENVIGETTTLGNQPTATSVKELLGELAGRGGEALRDLQRRAAAYPDKPSPTPSRDRRSVRERCRSATGFLATSAAASRATRRAPRSARRRGRSSSAS